MTVAKDKGILKIQNTPLIRQELDANEQMYQEDTLKFIGEQIDKFLEF